MSRRDHESSIGRGEYRPGRLRGTRVLASMSVLTAAIGVLAIAGPALASSPVSWGAPAVVDRAAPFYSLESITGVSCASESLCVGVDGVGDVVTSMNPTGGKGAWTVTSVDGLGYLKGVSCAPSGLCAGYDGDGNVVSSTDPTGGTGAWTLAKIDPHVVGENSDSFDLQGMSCPSASLCVAVDSSGNVLTSTDPTGGASTWTKTNIDGTEDFFGVSCPTSRFCVATAGDNSVFVSSDPTGGASAWTKTQLAVGRGLGEVSCASESLCIAIEGNGNPGEWGHIVTSTDPAGGEHAWSEALISPESGIESVSCVTGLCVAGDGFGHVFVSTNPTGGAGEWTKARVDGAHTMYGVSCASTSLCVTAGGEGTITTSTNPTGGSGAWSVADLEVGTSSFGDISCTSGSLCVAVDDAGNVVSTIDPTGGSSAWSEAHVDSGGGLWRVSCGSPALCVATDSNGNVVSTSNPTGGSSQWSVASVDSADYLRGISCAPEGLCVAVDEAGNVVTSTDPTGGAGAWTPAHVDSHGLSGVSCPSNDLCVAVDGENVLTSTDPTGGAGAWTITHLGAARGVSCPSVSFCVTVAGEGTVTTSTNPTGGEGAWSVTHVKGLLSLSEVSCASESLCVARPEALSFYSRDVLVSTDPSGGAPAWTEENVYGETPYEQTGGIEPEIIVDRGLAGVSCASEGVCVAADINSRVIAGTLSAPKPEPPAIESESVSNVTEHDATLEAQINTHGSYTGYWFQIDTNSSYDFTQPNCPFEFPGDAECESIRVGEPLPVGLVEPQPQYIPAGSGEQSVRLDLASIAATLQPNTTYHYRVIASGGGAPVVQGPDQTFTTLSPRGHTLGSETGSANTNAQSGAAGQGDESLLSGIKPPGSAPGKKAHPKPLTRAEQLASALKQCKKEPRRKRAACAKQARKNYLVAGKERGEK
jgi:hypothetical protein